MGVTTQQRRRIANALYQLGVGRLAQLLYQSVSKIAVTDGDFYFDEFVVAQRSVNLCEHVCAQAITPNTHDGVELMRNGPVLPEHSVAQ